MSSKPYIQKFATLKDVAALAGTTAATVSYVLSGAKNRYVSDEMREKVERAAAELNYVKSAAASSLKGKKADVIAVLSPQYENHFFAEIFAAIERAAHKKGVVIATLNTFDDPEREKFAINQMVRLRVDGFLIIPTIGGGFNTENIRQRQLPFVSMERPLAGAPADTYDFISSDNFEASRQLTENALVKGHKRIALVYWQSEITSNIFNLKERMTGYIHAMQSYGIYDPSLLFCGDITREDGARLTAQILQDKTVTAIVYAHYILAEGGIRHLRRAGVNIPADISVSLLGAPTWLDMSEPDFTHIIQPGEQIGQEAARILFERIDGIKSKPVSNMLPVTLHEGESVASISATNH